MSYKPPDYRKIGEQEGLRMECYAPALNVIVLATYAIATAVSPAAAGGPKAMGPYGPIDAA